MSLFGFGKSSEEKFFKKHSKGMLKAQKAMRDFFKQESKVATAERIRKEEIERNKKASELYHSRTELKRAKHSASHPYGSGSGFGLGKKAKSLGKSGKMRFL